MGWWIKRLTTGHRAAIAARLRELPEAERRPLLSRARRAAYGDWRTYVPLVVSVIAGVVAVAIASESPAPASPLAVTSLVAGFAAMVWSDVLRHRLVRRHLAAQFPTLCPACGYDRRTTPARCPECGTESPAAP